MDGDGLVGARENGEGDGVKEKLEAVRKEKDRGRIAKGR